MGVIKDHNYEAMHFLSINQQVMWKGNHDWYKPAVPKVEEWHDIPAQELFREHFRLNGKLAQIKQALRGEDWGWKDPRNTFTLDMWLKKFPKAKVIHLVRDKNAVINSLQRRNKISGEVQAEELNDLEYCAQLWQSYVDQGQTYAKKLGDRYLEIKYEDLRQGEEKTIAQLEQFCGKPLQANIKKYLR